jgi:glycosyltransferase involved in cell wall biosynthesis
MPPRPRVMFAIGGLGRGGSERQLVELVAAAHPDQIEATIVTLSTDCDAAHRETLAEAGVELIQLSPPGGPRALRPAVAVPRMLATMRRVRPDLVYAWLEEASATVTPPALALRIPVLVARRSVCGSKAERHAFFRVPIRWAERRARLVTGNSEAVLANAEERGVRRERLRLTRNGHRPVDPLPPPEADEVAFGYVANYRSEKGHMRLLDAVEKLDRSKPWRFDLVGSGPLRDEVATEIAARGLGDRVEAAGPVTDIQGFWADHDVAVLLSDDEGSPNALIEAALLGRPLVGTNGGGTPEIVDREAGLLVSSDPSEIAAALERLIDDPRLRLRLGEGARRHALRQHDLQASVETQLAAIREALGGAPTVLRDRAAVR